MQDILLVDKPSGIATHSPVEGDPSFGFVEHIEARAGQKLWVCHRLDKETFGSLVFATSKQQAAKISQAFEVSKVQKTYLFLTHRRPRQNEFTIKSYITKQQGEFLSFEPRGDQQANAETSFKQLRELDGYYLWEAKPATGKPHQIRLQAQQANIPILGDKEHGGASFPSLMLQSHTLEAELNGEKLSHTTPVSKLFENLELLKNKTVSKWILAIERRERYARSVPNFGSTVRLIHTDGGKLRCEKLGDVISLQWFADEGEEISEEERENIDQLIKAMKWNQWRLQIRYDRGKSPNDNPEITSTPPPPEKWQAQEGTTTYEFRRDTSLSTGLFLDQRANRRFIKSAAAEKSVLNLFCYTGGFSVIAALGGAKQTTSVDISKNFLEWTKRNFELNNLNPQEHLFYAMDSREFLKWAAKKNLQYDVIVCDPPSFGRTKESVFRIEKDFPELLFSLVKVLAPKGKILFSTNYEKWTQDSLNRLIRQLIREKKFPLTLSQSAIPDLDFEMPGEGTILKSAWLESTL